MNFLKKIASLFTPPKPAAPAAKAEAKKPIATPTPDVTAPAPTPVAAAEPAKAPKKIEKISDAGMELMKHHEGCRLTAYADPASPRARAMRGDPAFKGQDPKTLSGAPLTIGYGSTGPHVTEGLRITQAEAEALFRKDLERFEKGVLRLVKVPVNQNEFDALVCFAYNIGLGNLEKSSVLRKLNAEDRKGAADSFLLWNKAQGQVLPGLTKRRNEERALFLKES